MRLPSRLLTWLTAAVDIAPGAVRFGPGRELRRRVLSRPLPELHGGDGVPSTSTGTSEVDGGDRMVVLATRSLGTGGVEAVVATLARSLPHHGLHVLVLSSSGGATGDELARTGTRVAVVQDEHAAARALAQVPVGTVAELHNAPDWLVEACRRASLRLVPVHHTTDFDLSPAAWRAQRTIAEGAAASIAVSATVRAFCRSRLGGAGPEIEVVPNGVHFEPITRDEIGAARGRLSEIVGERIGDDVVFCSLVRYNSQKNVPGLVAAFLRAAEQRSDIRLVVAGPVDDWVEHALSAALVAQSPHARRVLLLGPSTSRTVLAAADAFVLDSFFEGWPVAATEAARAGLPLILSEVGGAAELLGADARLGHQVPNPAGPPDSMTMRRIRAARRRPAHQRNRDELAAALVAVARDRDHWRERRSGMAAQSRWLDADAMVERHAASISAIMGLRQ